VNEKVEGGGINLVIDEWTSEELYRAFIQENKTGYDELEAKAKLASRSKKRIWIGI